MKILIFVYYMLYTLFDKLGHFIYRNSPFTVHRHNQDISKGIEPIIENTTNSFYFFGLALYSLVIYIYLPSLGLEGVREYLLSIMNRKSAIVCILILESVPIYILYFYNDKYLKYFRKFQEMNFFSTFLYSVIGLFLIILPVILLFAAI